MKTQTTKPPKTLIKHPLIQDYFPSSHRESLQPIHYPAGEIIYRQGEELEYLVYFLEGKIKISHRLFNGKEHILGIHDQAIIIGGIELLTDKPLVSSVTTLEDSWLVLLPVKHHRKQLLSDSDFLYKIGQTLALSLYQQNIQTSANLGYTVKERLANHLLSIQEPTFRLELSILADSFGTSYRHLLRSIHYFIEQGFLTKTNKTYQIANRSGLEKWRIKE